MLITTDFIPLLLLSLCNTVTSVPIIVHAGNGPSVIWVTSSNTLNSTSWNGRPNIAPARYRMAPRASSFNTIAPSKSNGIFVEDSRGRLSMTSLNTTDTLNNTGMVMEEDSRGRLSLTNVTTSTNHRIGTTNTSTADELATKETRPKHTTLLTNTTSLHGFSTGPPRFGTSASLNHHAGSRLAFLSSAVANVGSLTLSLVNKMPSSNIKVYVSGLDPNGALIMLGQEGNWEYPTTTSSKPQPVGANVELSMGAPNTTTTLTLPGYINSARIWIADGGLQFFVVATPYGPGLVEPAAVNPNDPNAETNYAFAEFTWGADYGIYADITAVDFVGLPLGIRLTETNGNVQTVLGTPSNAAPVLCNQLIAQSQVDGRAWNQLCAYTTTGALVRVIAPSNYVSQVPNGFGTYFARYVNDVWNYYRHHDLIIDTQSTPGNITCRVQGALLQCAGDNRGYAKPNNIDIFGCNTGPFALQWDDNAVHYAVVPRLCAAFNRATLLIDGGNVQPSLPASRYYMNENRPVESRPKNWYSELVHRMEGGGRGYAFSYDDVVPRSGEDQSGLVASTSPAVLSVIVGGT